MSYVEIELSNPRKRTEKLSLKIDIFNTHIAKLWLSALKELVEQGFYLKKDYCFLGFPEAPEGIDFWCRRLNAHIKKVNDVNKKNRWPESYFIHVKADSKEIFSDGKYNPTPMFKVHHDFELLIGQDWRPSVYFEKASSKEKYSIIQLNEICHQIEWLGKSKQQFAINPKGVHPSTMVSFLYTPKYYFEEDHWKYFSLDSEFGGTYVKYWQKGKNHWEVFFEGDPEIFPENINGLKHYTGQFSIDWGTGMTKKRFQDHYEKFAQWMKKQNLSPDDPKLGIGRIQVGQLRKDIFGKMKIPEIHRLLANYLNIERITVHMNSKEKVSMVYPQTYLDPGFEIWQEKQTVKDFKRAHHIDLMTKI